MPGAAIDHLLMHGIELVALGLHGRAEDRILHEIVDRQHAQHRVENRDDAVAIKPDQPPRILQPGIIAVDDGDLVAVAHGPQRRQQLRAQQRVKSLQHSRPP
jgi:hypothetical protein